MVNNYYENNKEKLRKEDMKDIKIFLKKKKKKVKKGQRWIPKSFWRRRKEMPVSS